MALSIANIRTEIAAALAAGSSDSGGVKISVETRLNNTGTDQGSSCFRVAANDAVHGLLTQLLSASGTPTTAVKTDHTDRIAMIQLGTQIYFVGRVTP
jgi:hypothetical protein